MTSQSEAARSAPAVHFLGVRKRYGDALALDDVSFDVRTGEFFSILGPSGCGKTTTLRLLAGFERPDAGEIRLHGERLDDRPPWERPVAMVFQSYALFPHLSVAKNVAFGLERRKLARAEIAERVDAALSLVRLDRGTYGGRSPGQLSGGQRQRVALARALVLEPPVLLLDEPLGALDRQLRKEMQIELRALNRQLGITFLYVTHDQEEALAMSDRIAVMSRARIAQIGTPVEVYESPRTEFVAAFLGETNVFDAAGGRVAVRPERVALHRESAGPPPGRIAHPGALREVVYLGDRVHAVVALDSGRDVLAALPGREAASAWRRGDRAIVAWSAVDERRLEDA